MKKTSMGIDENVAGFLCYLLGWVSGLIILLIEKENKLVRFHAAQSVVVFGAVHIINVIFGRSYIYGGGGVFQLISIAALILWIFLLIKAWNREYFKLPVAGDLAEKLMKSIKP